MTAVKVGRKQQQAGSHCKVYRKVTSSEVTNMKQMTGPYSTKTNKEKTEEKLWDHKHVLLYRLNMNKTCCQCCCSFIQQYRISCSKSVAGSVQQRLSHCVNSINKMFIHIYQSLCFKPLTGLTYTILGFVCFHFTAFI